MPNWIRVVRLNRGGLRLFWDGSQRIAIADNSGKTPEHTEDGVLWLDKSRPCHIGVLGTGSSEKLFLQAPVTKGNGSGLLSVWVDEEGILTFMESVQMVVKVSQTFVDKAKLYETILKAADPERW